MTNRDRARTSNKNALSVYIVVLAILLVNALNLSAVNENLVIYITVIVVIALVWFAVAYTLAKKKSGGKTASIYNSERAKEKAKQIFMREEFEEQAVKCAHPRGKEKYIAQLDNFLSNGLIDKAEYCVLKERYEKAQVPDNMH